MAHSTSKGCAWVIIFDLKLCPTMRTEHRMSSTEMGPHCSTYNRTDGTSNDSPDDTTCGSVA